MNVCSSGEKPQNRDRCVFGIRGREAGLQTC